MMTATHTVMMPVQLSDDELVELVKECIYYEGIVDFIKKLELRYADWSISEELYEYFKEQHEVYLKESNNDD